MCMVLLELEWSALIQLEERELVMETVVVHWGKIVLLCAIVNVDAGIMMTLLRDGLRLGSCHSEHQQGVRSATLQASPGLNTILTGSRNRLESTNC